MLGGAQTANYGETCCVLEPGSTVMLYSDGLVQRRGENLEDGLARLLQAAATTAAPTAAGALDPDHLCERVLAELFPHRPPDDDVAMLAITRGESAIHAALSTLLVKARIVKIMIPVLGPAELPPRRGA